MESGKLMEKQNLVKKIKLNVKEKKKTYFIG